MSAPLSPAEQTAAAIDFVNQWTGKGYEKGQTHAFWLDLLHVLGVEKPSAFIEFEDGARLDTTHGFIDGWIPSTHVLMEQKSLGLNLRAPIRQSDGTLLTPFQQARRYAATLPYSQRPRWIVTCNFAEFHVYDMENPNAEPESILLANLPDELYRLRFLVNAASDRVAREMAVSIEAGGLVGRIYDALLVQYGNPTPEILHWLNVLCVRLVFCLYAEDAGIFADDQFHDYLALLPPEDIRDALLKLFDVLDTPPAKRSPYLKPALAAFPYVNGSLFSGPVEIPQFTEELRDVLLQKASLGFDWAEISPTIFGAVFESTLNPETRRSGGMHYTSIENIHKVIDPLFLDGLQTELNTLLEAIPPVENLKLAKGGREYSWQMPRETKNRLLAFQDKLASLTFLDPACGSGNFLTETYLSLRRMENEVISALLVGPQGRLGGTEDEIQVKVSIAQFHGIEINDFAVSVARTALWIAESQMLAQTSVLLHRDLDFLPLKSYVNIREGNALHMDWREGVNAGEDAEVRRGFDYIIGNPPFVGKKEQTPAQKTELVSLFSKKNSKAGILDYVSGWYVKAAQLMQGSNTKAAFVSTNSITQGEQVPALWKELQSRFGVQIDFAFQTFRWDSESTEKAHVHCVVIGFSCNNNQDTKRLFTSSATSRIVRHINPYLLEGDDIYIESRSAPLANIPQINYGSFALDDGHYTVSKEEYQALTAADPDIAPYLRVFLGAQELLHAKQRWCVWLQGAEPSDIKRHPALLEKIEAVQSWRRKSDRKTTVLLADTPMLFAEIRQPDSDYLAIPTICSERRRYIPSMFLHTDVVASNQLYVVPNATFYHFGILISNVHMAWMRVVGGRLKSDYRYSAAIVYNNFPWPTPSAAQKTHIENTARAILEARASHPTSSLADLYDERLMPPDLRAAHRANDRAVMAAYGFDVKMTESDCVAELFKLYQTLAKKADGGMPG